MSFNYFQKQSEGPTLRVNKKRVKISLIEWTKKGKNGPKIHNYFESKERDSEETMMKEKQRA